MDPPMVSMANREPYQGPNRPTIKDEASLSPADVHVLLVDDERLSRTVVANLLRKCSYQVTTAENGAEAMELLRSQGPFDLVLTDVCMPEVNGIQLLNYVKNNENLRCVPVVMMSSIEQGHTVCECVKGGAEEYLVKPVTRKEVQHIWQHVLRQQQQQQQKNNNSNNASATSLTATNSTEQLGPNKDNIPVPDEQPAFSGEEEAEAEAEAKKQNGRKEPSTTHQHQHQQLSLAHMNIHHHQIQQLQNGEKQSRKQVKVPSSKATSSTLKTTDDADYDSTLHFLALLKNERLNKMKKLEVEIALLESDITTSALTLDKIEEIGAILNPLEIIVNKDATTTTTTTTTTNNNNNNNNNNNKRKRLEDKVVDVYDEVVATVAAPAPTKTHMLQNNNKNRNSNPERVHASMAQLEEAFFSRRTAHPDKDGLDSFGRDLQVLADRHELSLLASIRSGDLATGHEMVCCADFDADDEHFATVSVSCCLKVFNFQSAILGNGDDNNNMFVDEAYGHNRVCSSYYDEDALPRNTHHDNDSNNKVQYPVWQATTRSKLSSVSWNSYIRSHLLTSDYDGLIQLWDVNSTVPTKMEVSTFDEHARRVWAVDFSKTDPLIFASASDDATVRVWHTNHSSQTGASVTRITAPSNVCSVQFSPTNSHLLAAGCANHRAYLYDLRKADSPLAGVVVGPQRAVSYVRFMAAGSGVGGSSSKEQLVTASTDSTVRLWDIDTVCSTSGGGDAVGMDSNNRVVKVSKPVCSFKGHKNERNFVGLSVTDDGFIACGSENNSVYCYWKSLPFAISSMSFDKQQVIGNNNNNNNNTGAFVSAVSWARGGKHCLAANSQGTLSILSLK